MSSSPVSAALEQLSVLPAGDRVRLSGLRAGLDPGDHYGPSQTAGLIAASLPGVPVAACDLAGDYLPFVPDPNGLPASFASFLAGF